ncbi:unnamed protein product [Chondrus crispus]|uniref:Uncharacterized protein n=1 Tax=Chondrus crispus TaxID=2769 RepID=S0F3U4_CHOCR|nr:unnamed protein product [Chondrus crispus]CDF77438.1 unnamed protein product [Chondrus crispus]|eukprot:XP_005712312.1 unnamed protein product [Chondrus crispus]
MYNVITNRHFMFHLVLHVDSATQSGGRFSELHALRFLSVVPLSSLCCDRDSWTLVWVSTPLQRCECQEEYFACPVSS